MKNYSEIAKVYLAAQVKTRGSIPLIAKELSIPKAWLYKVAQGKIPNPQVNRVMKVINYKDSQNIGVN